MFPLRDTIRSRTFPIITWLLVIVNVLVFLFEVSLPTRTLNQLIFAYGVVPARFSLTNPLALLSHPLTLVTLFTHMFLHGGWLHVISNLWTLLIFGDNVEDRMGKGRYLVFYLIGGLVAAFAQIAVDPSSTVPSIGASGAIAGVLGAYILLFPGGRVLTFIPIFILPWLVEVPAFVFLGFWFVSQLFSGLLSLPHGGVAGGVAWWAHIGGFIFGAVFHRLFLMPSEPVIADSYTNERW